MSFKLKPLHCKDSYKLGHFDMYPEGTDYVYSNFTPRSDKLNRIPEPFNDHLLVWLGIQATMKYMKELWDEEFFQKPLYQILADYRARTPAFTGDSDPNVERFIQMHNLGYLPLHVKALPEGSKVPMGIPVFTVINTVKGFGWLTNDLETIFSNEGWHLPTNATIAASFRKIFTHFAELTGSPKEFVDWQGHCFADRGMSGMMAAAKNNAGHSALFYGSDSVSTFDWIDYYYGTGASGFFGGSVPATEHSVMCMGSKEGERETFKRLIAKYPTGLLSIVSDTWDFFKVINEIAPSLKEEILARQPNELGMAKVVFRPDSGNPVDILCGTAIKVTDLEYDSIGTAYPVPAGFEVVEYNGKYYKSTAKGSVNGRADWNEVPYDPSFKGAVEILWDHFGGTTTESGFKVLHERVGLIYGDSITPERAIAIFERLAAKGFASCNVVLGIGSYTYQYSTRDTFGFAMKATWGVVNGVPVEIFKDPATDKGKLKKSAKGLLRVEFEDGKFVLYDQQTPEQEQQGLLQSVFKDGQFYNYQNWDQIIAKARA